MKHSGDLASVQSGALPEQKDTLLPCPFCGGGARVCFGLSNFNDVLVRCDECDVEGPNYDIDDGSDMTDQRDKNKADAVAHWNTRATDAKHSARPPESTVSK